MAGYIGSNASVVQIDGYNRTEADAEFVQVAGDTMTGALTGTDLTLSGGVYLGGTGSANKLDDYEEGTWTPTVTTGTVSLSGGMGASYVKIGKVVHFQFYITWANTANNDGNTFYIGGLPFTPADHYSAFSLGYCGLGNVNDFAPTVNYGNSTLYFHYNDGAGGGTVVNSVIHSRGIVILIGSGSYVTNA